MYHIIKICESLKVIREYKKRKNCEDNNQYHFCYILVCGTGFDAEFICTFKRILLLYKVVIINYTKWYHVSRIWKWVSRYTVNRHFYVSLFHQKLILSFLEIRFTVYFYKNTAVDIFVL